MQNVTKFTVIAEYNEEKFDLTFELPGDMTPEMWESTKVKFQSLLSMMKDGAVVAEEAPATEDVAVEVEALDEEIAVAEAA